MKRSTSGSVKFVWMSLIVQHVLSVCFRWIECLKIAFRTNVDIHMQCTKLINWKFVWLASSGRKFIYGRLKLLIQLIGSTRPKFDVSPNRRSWFNVGRPKLEFGSSHEKFDVWPRSIRRDHETTRERKHFHLNILARLFITKYHHVLFTFLVHRSP